MNDLRRQPDAILEGLRLNLVEGCLKALDHHENGTLDVAPKEKAAPPRIALGLSWMMLLQVEAEQERRTQLRLKEAQ
jgi:hypothetical protein